MASRPVRFPEIDDELRKIIDANMDEVPARKRAREAFKDIQLGIDHILFKVLFFEKRKKEFIIIFSILIVLGTLLLLLLLLWELLLR